MLRSLLPYFADIRRPFIANTAWEDYKSYTVVYSWVSCRYYSDNINLNNTDIWAETSINKYKVILTPENYDIKIWDEIDLYDTTMSDIWTFIIDEVKAQRLFSSIDHMALKITKI